MSKRRADRLNRIRREKRGVVLLVVVSILTLFLMIGVTYVLVAGNYHNASGKALLAKRHGDESEREMEEVIGQILYGTVQTGAPSVIGPHNLLADLYGNEQLIGTITAVNPPPFDAPPLYPLNGGQCIVVRITGTNNIIPNYFAGRVFTFIEGPATGLSTRVMAYFPAGAPYPDPMNPGTMLTSGVPEVIIETPESDLPVPVLTSVTASANSRFIINGAPFNGTGAGFDPATHNLDGVVTINSNSYGKAYLPNAGQANMGFGGLDETWDAADYQNMFLAMVPPRKVSQFDGFPLLPSYHRPDLVQFWIESLRQGGLLNGLQPAQARQAFLQPFGPDGIPFNMDDPLPPQETTELITLKRMILMRPLREDHPNFTGGNQNFVEDSVQGPYDVDNDGDGISDSIWVDAGLPVVTDKSGRRYKRLVAVLIKDLDGRVNPNVHGNMLAEWNPQGRTRNRVNDFSGPVTLAGVDYTNPQDVYTPRGSGFGPSEVDFRHIVGDDTNVYQNILQMRYFGPNGGTGKPGIPNTDDGWSQLRTIGMPGDPTNPPVSAWSTPPDVWGRAALAVDYTGQPLWMVPVFPMGYPENERFDEPYEVQWDSAKANSDSPYTVSELEALLRYHDLGAAVIPSRLMQAAQGYLAPLNEPRGTIGPSQPRRDAFGIGSYIPSPRLAVPRELRNQINGATSPTILDLYATRLTAANMAEIRTIVPFEFLKGQIFNLNREFGNGQHDQTMVDPAATNANTAPFGTVDDPSEYGSETIPTTAGPYPFNYLNDSPPANTPDPRQMYARHLYCLALLLRNQNSPDAVDFDLPPDGPSAPETARLYAQWAINVVDFRDADSIMTPFEYDINPFNGWNVDGNLQTNGTAMAPENVPPGTTIERGLVWGCERPELLIMETINGHDRGTEDRMDDVYNGAADNGRVADPEKDGNSDFDQRLSPTGFTFIEIYNPWFDRSGGAYDHKAGELYADADGNPNTTGDTGVDLSRVNTSGSPVWRMVVVTGTPTNKNNDPDYPRPEALMFDVNGAPQAPPPGAPSIERSIYFADLAAPMGVVRPSSGDGEAFFPSSTIFPPPMGGIPRIPPVLPGRYAVIGSAGYANGGIYTTNIGRRTTDPNQVPTRPDYANTRRIDLNPGVSVEVRDNVTDGAADVPTAANLPPVVAVPVDMVIRGLAGAQQQSLSISEQVGGYPGQPGAPPLPAPQAMSMWIPPTPTEEGYYAPPIDTPLDSNRMDGGGAFVADNTIINYRALHLQRLANPLVAWDPVTNPYMTVDTSSMDVMAYNGVALDPATMIIRQNFQTFQRGGRFYDSDTPMVGGYTAPVAPQLRPYRDLWPSEATPANLAQLPGGDSPTEATASPHFQTHPLYHTLGYLNKRYHGTVMQPYFGAGAGSYFGAPYHLDENGAIAPTFPYLAFNNRPFNNPMELLQVPCWHSSALLMRHGSQNVFATPNSWTNMYDPANTGAPYGHLLNFFQTFYDPNNPNANSTAPEMSRLLDYVETRTPYLETEKYYKPDAPANFFNDPNTPSGYRPPFNYLSRFREPGRININTIFDSDVWNAAVRGYPGMCTLNPPDGDGTGSFLFRLGINRQGWGAVPGDLLTVAYNPTFPSYFSNPFRTADSADMMPPLPAQLRQSPANGGLLRQDPFLGNLPFMPGTPIPPFPAYPTVDPNQPQPLFSSTSATPYQDATRNPYFRYQPMQKVGNIFATNSNCYAVWITVGYFEVEANDTDNNTNTPAVIDVAHPDGLRLAQEVGVDSGEVKRHRSFFIIDRSIPVGFEPGHRHNTDKAILLKRFIE